MAIEPFVLRDISQLEPLQPHGWSSIIPFYQFYSETDFCYPIKFTSRGRIIGIGAAILHRHTGWLAHIIVDTNFRGQGIGTKITLALIQNLPFIENWAS
jgi:GNAT superfamily N-acetyltransferase